MSQEAQLIKGCKKNDRKAQRSLYEEYCPRMMAVAIRYTRTAEDAHDILQEAFVKVFQKISTFRGDASLSTWIRKIVVNTAINFQRSKLYLHPMVDVQEMHTLSEEAFAISQYSMNELLGMLQKLPDGCRIVFNLYAIEGYKHKEIANMTGISEGTSKSQYARARKLLQVMIDEAQEINYEKVQGSTS